MRHARVPVRISIHFVAIHSSAAKNWKKIA